jgi:hypothetical protein
MPKGIMQKAAAGAGMLRMAIRQRTLRPHPAQPHGMKRMLHAVRRT